MHRTLPLALLLIALVPAPSHAVVRDAALEARGRALAQAWIAARLEPLERAPTFRGTVEIEGERVPVVAALLPAVPSYRALSIVDPARMRVLELWLYTESEGSYRAVPWGPIGEREPARSGYCPTCALARDGSAIRGEVRFGPDDTTSLDLVPVASLSRAERAALAAARLFEPDAGDATARIPARPVVGRAGVRIAWRGGVSEPSTSVGEGRLSECALELDVAATIAIGDPAHPASFALETVAIAAARRSCCTPPYRGCCAAPPRECVETPLGAE